MAKENFLTYPEVDPNSRIAVTQDRVTWANITRPEVAYVYSDKGVNYFDGNFVHLLTVVAISVENGMSAFHWAIANDIGTEKAIADASGSELYLNFLGLANDISLSIAEMDAGTLYGDSYTADRANIEGTVYYLKIGRDEAVGTYGTLYCYIYSDAARTTLVDTLSVALHTSKKDFRYLYGFQGWGVTADTAVASGFTENLTIEGGEASVLPEVATLALTNITATTAIGNGNITSLGLSAVTEHGHCWATAANPTTADSKTTNGAGEVGAFTSSITGLTPGTKYYVRAYATNSYGTSYGANYSFIAGSNISQRYTREIGVKTTELRYIGEDGIEYKVQGTAV